jgi:hypothetical protein
MSKETQNYYSGMEKGTDEKGFSSNSYQKQRMNNIGFSKTLYLESFNTRT